MLHLAHACVYVWMCVKVYYRFAGPTLLTRSCDCVIWVTSAESSITIRNTRNYATSEKVKSQGKFAVVEGQLTRFHPSAPRKFLLTFSGRAVSAKIRISYVKIEELSHADVSISVMKSLSPRYWTKYQSLILLKNSKCVLPGGFYTFFN